MPCALFDLLLGCKNSGLVLPEEGGGGGKNAAPGLEFIPSSALVVVNVTYRWNAARCRRDMQSRRREAAPFQEQEDHARPAEEGLAGVSSFCVFWSVQFGILPFCSNGAGKGKRMLLDAARADGDAHRAYRAPSRAGAVQKNCKPMMCAYKLVTANFDYFGLRSKVEEYCINYEKNLFLASHKQVLFRPGVACAMIQRSWHRAVAASARVFGMWAQSALTTVTQCATIGAIQHSRWGTRNRRTPTSRVDS